MPKALVALVATAVCLIIVAVACQSLILVLQVEAALKDYCSGLIHSTEFLAEVYGGVYSTHMKVLEEEQSEQPLPFHITMSKLFQDTMYVPSSLIHLHIPHIQILQWL